MPHPVLILSRRYWAAREAGLDEFLARRDCVAIEHEASYPIDEDQLCRLIAPAKAIIPGLERITPRVMDSAPNLKVIAVGGVGFDHIDVRAANERRIVVANSAGANNLAVAEHAMTLMLMLAKRVRGLDASVREGGWGPWRVNDFATELWDKTLGIVGLGRVGKSTSLLARAFGMRVLAHDIAWDITFANQNRISYVPLDTLLAQSDFVTLHCPLTDATRYLIDDRAIDLMKPGAYLINTARGPVVKESALVNALSSGRIAGAGIDVFEVEPHPDNPYVEFDNVVLTPHTAGVTQEFLQRSMYLALTNITNVLNGLPPHSQVNPDFTMPRW